MSVRALSVSPRKRNIHSTGTNQFSSEETNSKNEEYCIHLSLKQIITIAIGSMIVSFLAGRVLSDQVQVNDARLQKVLLESVSNIDDDTLKTKEESGDVLSLSALTKDLDYNDTLRLFPITHAKMNSSEIRRSVHRDKCLMDSPFCNSHLDGFGKNNSLVEEERENDSENIELEKYDSNSLQQLSIDMENVEYELADSSERLTAALMQLIEQTSETLLSYECHGLEPSGLTCIGILVKGHVVARTWPNDRVIMLDLFTSGSEILIDLVPTIIDSFGSLDSKAFHIIWSHKYRGFRDCPSGNDNLEDSDLGRTLGHIGWEKERVASFQTNFQRIDIYDIIEPRFDSPTENSVFIQHDGSIQSSNSVLSEKDRIVYLDGVMQSRRYGESAYHEALVHPAIFAHENPKRIAIIGGGEGATLREVLKHNTVDKVVMIEIDEKMVNVSRAYLPGWSDCTNILGSSHSCFEDPRSEMYYEDAITWFIDRFGPKGENIPGEQFDVIIMDAL